MIYAVDVNCDVGEGVGNEAELMPYISSCSIACGGHAGDESIMREVVKLAKQHEVTIGAHPSFPDKENFGRQPMQMPHETLVKTIIDQVGVLSRIAEEEGVELHYIKPHGALYNMAANTRAVALAVIDAVKHISKPKMLFVPFGSVIAELAKAQGVEIVYEAFADRNYNEDLTLVSRKNTEAVISDSDVLFNHIYKMITEQKVVTLSGVEVAIKAETFCVHGDNPKAIDLIKNTSQKLKENNIQIQSFL